jgi:hypothetical protein
MERPGQLRRVDPSIPWDRPAYIGLGKGQVWRVPLRLRKLARQAVEKTGICLSHGR